MRLLLLTAASAAALALAGCTADTADAQSAETAAVDHTAQISAAVAKADRPEAARALDESRKPVETLAWLGLAPGMDAADLVPGEGYWTEIMAHVVGPQGSVVGLQPNQFYTSEDDAKAWAALEVRAPGTSMTRVPFGPFEYAPNSFDFMMFNLNYHDLYWESEQFKIEYMEPSEVVRSMYNVMRPGGVVAVIDHVGKPGNTREIVDKTHRIDPAVVIADFEKEGFELVGQSDILANPEDDHSLGVFDPSVRGKTDRFMLKFRKPAS